MSPAQARLALLGALVTHRHPVDPRHVAASHGAGGLRWRYHCPHCRATCYGIREDLDEAIAAIHLCPLQHDAGHQAAHPADGAPLLPFCPDRHPPLGP